MKNYQLTINNKKIVDKLIFHNLALLLIIHCSLILVNCSNPLIIRILAPKTVSFETNGGSNIESQTVYRDYPIKRPPNPSKSGHTFDAWYSDNGTFGEQWDFAAIPNADITLYAKWIEGEGYIVTFKYNYTGAPEDEIEIVPYGGKKLTTPTTTTRPHSPLTPGLYLNPVPAVLDLAGWFKDTGLTDQWNFSNDIVDKDMTLYAKWTDPSIPLSTGTTNTFIAMINYINSHSTNGESYTYLMNGEAQGPGGDPMPPFAANSNLTIKGISESKIIFNPSTNIGRSLFTINNASAKVTLGNNITLQGISNGTNSLIIVTSGTLVMETGSEITGHNGRGVHVNGGTFNMNGGTISNTGKSSAYSNTGDGVYVSNGTFTMNGGTISENGNTGSAGGGVAVSDGGIFIMNNGNITGNIAPSGGGVHVSEGGTFSMNGGTISEHGSDNGGGVTVDSSGTFNMTDGIISENGANNGAGVNVGSNGIFNMSGGTITGNTANSTFFGGGGVYSSGTFNMTGGIISGNTAATSGGGVFVSGNGSFKISKGIVYGNDYNDLLNNTAAGAGAALYVEAQGTAQWFSNSIWSDIISGSNNSPKYSDDTINFLY